MNVKILWVDDEIEHLHAHILFLQKKGYDVVIASNGIDAIEHCAAVVIGGTHQERAAEFLIENSNTEIGW